MNALLSALLKRLRRSGAETRQPCDEELAEVQASTLFDADWYTDIYPDVTEAGIDPLLHFMIHGHREARDPGPSFSTSGYRFVAGDRMPVDANPLVFYLKAHNQAEQGPLPVIPGLAKRHRGPNILVCAHLAGVQSFGAELALLDVARALNENGYNVVVSVPAVGDPRYLDALRRYSVEVAIVPHRWWRHGRSPCARTVEHFRSLIARHAIRAVHLNTIVLFEQAVAAKDCNVPVVLHARELPQHDQDLCDTLGANADTIRSHVLTVADHLLANSQMTATYFGVDDPDWIVPDCIHWDKLPAPGYTPGLPLKVGLISSNLPKKGLHDFVDLARLLEAASSPIECVLIGPMNEHVRRLSEDATLPANLHIAGFAGSPGAALQQVDVVVNLSRVQESFGRTVVEAMSSGRPVISYSWGALPELVIDGETGYLVPLGDVRMVASRLHDLANSPQLCREMSDAARRHARAEFGFDRFATRLSNAYRQLHGTEPATFVNRESGTAGPGSD